MQSTASIAWNEHLATIIWYSTNPYVILKGSDLIFISRPLRGTLNKVRSNTNDCKTLLSTSLFRDGFTLLAALGTVS